MLAQRKGFALLVVIWGLGAIALLVVSFLTTGRLRLQTAFNVVGAAQAQSVAAAAANLAILSLATERVAQNGSAAPAPPNERAHDGAPNFCVLENAVVAFAVEDESGKVDLNTASEQLLQDVLVGLLGLPSSRAGDIARSIDTFRTPPDNDLPPPQSADGKPFGPKRAAFQTTLEFDQVAGVDAATFRALLPYVTVYSHAEGIDPHVAPPALVAALIGAPRDNIEALAATPYPNQLNRDDPRFPANYRQSGAHGAFLIHSEAVLANGPSAVQEYLVELQASDGSPFVVREVRHGVARYLAALRQMGNAAGALPPC